MVANARGIFGNGGRQTRMHICWNFALATFVYPHQWIEFTEWAVSLDCYWSCYDLFVTKKNCEGIVVFGSSCAGIGFRTKSRKCKDVSRDRFIFSFSHYIVTTKFVIKLRASKNKNSQTWKNVWINFRGTENWTRDMYVFVKIRKFVGGYQNATTKQPLAMWQSQSWTSNLGCKKTRWNTTRVGCKKWDGLLIREPHDHGWHRTTTGLNDAPRSATMSFPPYVHFDNGEKSRHTR